MEQTIIAIAVKQGSVVSYRPAQLKPFNNYQNYAASQMQQIK